SSPISRPLELASTQTQPAGPTGEAPVSHLAAGTRVAILSGVLALASVALLLVCTHVGLFEHLTSVPNLHSQPVIAVLLVVLFAAALSAPVSFHHRGHTYLFSLTEIPLLLGLAIAMPAWLVAARVLGGAIGFGVVRRQSPQKLAFNLTSGAFTTVVADIVYRAILHTKQLGAHAATPSGWVAGAAALTVAALASQLAVSLVVKIHGQRRPRSTRFEFVTFCLLLFASIGLAGVVVDAADGAQGWSVLPLVPLVIVGALIVFAYRGYLRLTKRFGALQQLYDFGRSLGGPQLEPAQTVWAVLERVQSVMRANRAEVILTDEWPRGRRAALRDEERSFEAGIPLDGSSAIARVISEGRVSLHVRPFDPAAPDQTADPVIGRFRDALVAPLTSGERVFGALLALDRQEQLDPFDDDDLRLFEALAAHASTTLERARLVEELRMEAESKSHQAMHDTLTGLPNRTLFLERASAALAESGRAAVALLDLDRFKEVNDTLGHSTGDRLLCEVAECLVRAAHGRATVARLGGDEFAVIVTDIIGPEEAVGIVRDLEAAVSQPINVDGITLAVRASAGVALAPEHGDNASKLLQRADIAMYLAKEKRSGIELYSPSQDQNMQRKLVLGGQLAQALAERGLHVVYQPIARLSTGELLRVEALCRWEHREFGPVPADEFIAIAAQMGLIGEITDFVLSEACAEAAKWRESGAPIDISVNLSGRDLSRQSLVDEVAAHLAANRLSPRSLTLEVTETEVMADLGEASSVLGRLEQLGVRVAVDDYGTGYSSLAYLHRLPLKELKIDRSFITNMATDPSNAIIVRSSITMAHSLDLEVTAEGAEDEVTCAVLADAGCDAVQGYYFARPLSASTLRDWLVTRPRLNFSRELPPALRLISGSGHSSRPGRDGMGQMGR
ncbi:MAG TPA: EAL domain-containing protein, partial [Acidimicrobiales bacterium]|nr:EAL domain-containing protein [Acidimicrobiales bacterium]